MCAIKVFKLALRAGFRAAAGVALAGLVRDFDTTCGGLKKSSERRFCGSEPKTPESSLERSMDLAGSEGPPGVVPAGNNCLAGKEGWCK
jgi:hypothetical protein